MTLKLGTDSSDTRITSLEGDFEDPCAECSLADVCVKGCCGNHRTCEQKSCYRECNDCGGGEHLKGTGADVPAICSKAPLKNIFLNQVRKEKYVFKRRSLIELDQRSVIITQGSVGRMEGCPYPEGTSAIAVNLRHVWSTRGWFSEDMKDYLRVPDGVELILLMSNQDDVLERAWGCEIYHDDIGAMGFDYWQGLTFSQYGSMSRFNNLWLGYRTLYCIEAGKAHFMDFSPVSAIDFKNDPQAYKPWSRCAKKLPQVIVNWQFTSMRDIGGYKWMVANLRRQLLHLPSKAIWFVGVVSQDMIYNLQRAFPEQECYFLAVNPWVAAQKGDEFTKAGKLKKSYLPRQELVLQNQRNYANLVEHAVKAAKTNSP